MKFRIIHSDKTGERLMLPVVGIFRRIGFLTGMTMCAAVWGIPMNHVPDTTEGLRPFMPAAVNANHLLVVNAGGIPSEEWSTVSTYA